MHQLSAISSDEVQALLRKTGLTIPETARVLGCGETALRGALQRGEVDLRVISIGSRRIVPAAHVKRLLGIEELVGSQQVTA